MWVMGMTREQGTRSKWATGEHEEGSKWVNGCDWSVSVFVIL